MALVVVAWVFLIDGHRVTADRGIASFHTHDHSAAPVAVTATHLPVGPLQAMWGWLAMSVAMMLPLALPGLRYVGLSSLRVRRLRSMTAFLLAYLLGWMLFGAVALLAGQSLPEQWRNHALPVTLVVVAGWQLTGWKRRALLDCHRIRAIRITGWRADRSCATFGLVTFRRCLISCWALMVVMAIVDLHIGWMAALTSLMVAEGAFPTRRRYRTTSAILILLVAVWVLLDAS